MKFKNSLRTDNVGEVSKVFHNYGVSGENSTERVKANAANVRKDYSSDPFFNVSLANTYKANGETIDTFTSNVQSKIKLL